MRIKDYTDTIRHLTDPFNIPEARRMIAENPALTQEQFKAGGIVEPGVTHYATEDWRIKQQAKNIKAQKDTWNKIGDAMWKANETGDMEYLMNKGTHKKAMMDGSMRNSWQKLSTNEDGLRHIAKEFKMDVDRVLDLMEEKKDFDIESTRLTRQEKILAKSSKLRSQFAKGEKWMMANGHRFNDPAKFKAAYIKRFGNGNAFIKAIKTGKASLFSAGFNAELLGAEGMIGQGSKLTKTLGDNIFSSVIYNMNDKVRNAITTEFERALTGDVPTVKYQARKILTQSPLLKKFGLDKKIHGPISRLIFKEIGDKMYENIQTFRQPRTTTLGLLKYLEDVVDPKYKSAISEARKAADYATRNKWKDAKKALNISDKINWDHKIPSFLIDSGYADKLEYAKLQPTTEHFNMKIKNAQFDRPMANLMEEWKKAPASQKANVITKMQDKIDDFSRKYGGYMEGVKVAPDKTGKPIFTSQAGPFTKKTDVIKSLKTSLGQEKFPTMNKNQQRKFIQVFLNENMDGKTLAQYKKFYPKCFEQDVGGNALRCLTKQAEKNSELFTKNSVSIAKATEGTKTSAQMINFLRKAKTLARGTGWLLAGEAIFAPLFALPMWAQGTPKDEIVDMLTYGAFGQGREEKIHEKLSPLGRAYVKTQELGEKGQALADQLTTASPQGYERSRIEHDLRELEKKYNQAASIFTPDPITGDYNQELINKGAQEVDDVTKYFEDIASGSQKERAAWLAPKTSEVMETVIDKPGKAFIDFTLGPNWKENLPQQQNQFYKKRYPRNPRELGQHLSYDPDIPMFAEGGIAGLLKK